MRKRLIIWIGIALCSIWLAGCAVQSVSAEPSSSASKTPIPTTPPDVRPTNDASSAEEEEDAMAVTHDGWVYYFDINESAVVDYNEDPPLHMKKTDGSNDKNMDIRGFEFDIIGDYIYIDANDPDLNTNGAQTWSTTRMTLNGSDKKKLEYASMSARFIPEGEPNFYFTTTGDSAIYVSDFSCEDVNVLIVTLPDKSEIDQKIGTDNTLQLNINDIANGYIDFDATYSTGDGMELYNGNYKITEDGKKIEKNKGTYYTYGSQENE